MKADLRPLAGMREECFSSIEATKTVINMVNDNAEKYLSNYISTEEDETLSAHKKLASMVSAVEQTIYELRDKRKLLAEESKLTSGSVRDSVDKLAQGLLKIEKTANFDRLERYVALLERASNAIGKLAEIEKTGKLDKIASALR